MPPTPGWPFPPAAPTQGGTTSSRDHTPPAPGTTEAGPTPSPASSHKAPSRSPWPLWGSFASRPRWRPPWLQRRQRASPGPQNTFPKGSPTPRNFLTTSGIPEPEAELAGATFDLSPARDGVNVVSVVTGLRVLIGARDSLELQVR